MKMTWGERERELELELELERESMLAGRRGSALRGNAPLKPSF